MSLTNINVSTITKKLSKKQPKLLFKILTRLRLSLESNKAIIKKPMSINDILAFKGKYFTFTQKLLFTNCIKNKKK